MVAGSRYHMDRRLQQDAGVVMVSENMARELWQTPNNALGKRVRVGTTDDWREVIGVVGDVHDDGMNVEASKTAYWPVLMKKFEGEDLRIMRSVSFALRTPRAGTESLMKDVRQAVWSVDPNLPLADVRTESYYYTNSMAPQLFHAAHAGGGRSNGDAPGNRGHLRRDRLLGLATYS